MNESFKSPQENLQNELSRLKQREGELLELAKKTQENIDVELGSEEYVDFGYTAELRDVVQPRILEIETALQEKDDVGVAQRTLNL